MIYVWTGGHNTSENPFFEFRADGRKTTTVVMMKVDLQTQTKRSGVLPKRLLRVRRGMSDKITC